MSKHPHPCLTCGACCACFRVSFYWTYSAEADPDGIPIELAEAMPPFRMYMKGTNDKPPRCVALRGQIGTQVSCSIYSKRPQACRDFHASWETGVPHDGCDQARLRHGLLPLKPTDWSDTDAPPERDPQLPQAA